MSSNDNKVSGGDDRFLKVKRDPRFWEMPEKERKIKIDKRFKSMFTDKRFKLKYTVDKRGRPINHTSSDDLKRFYNLSDTDDDEEKQEEASSEVKKVRKEKKEKKKKQNKKEEEEEESDHVTSDTCEAVAKKDVQVKGQAALRGVRVVEEGGDGDDDKDDESSMEEEEAKQRDGVTGSGHEDDDGDDDDDEDDGDSDASEDLARGFGNVETSSEEEEGEEEEEEEEDVEAILRKEEEQITHDWGELSKDAPRSDQVSSRLAVCNMDWDKIKAKDLMFVFNSFKPKGGVVISVKIYPSEFGKEKRELERSQGPMRMMDLPEDPDLDTQEQQVYRETLRDYQFKRLKYFYAVVECDSSQTADHIYTHCDRHEYESSCSVIDLRFIPDDVSFEGEEPTDVATDVGVSAYTPKMFICAASGTSTVKLTWDENDHDRVTALSRDFKKDTLMDMDFNAYLASSSEEEGEGPGVEWAWPGGGEGEGPGAEEEEELQGEGAGPGTGGAESDEKEKKKGVPEKKRVAVRPRQKKQRTEQQIQKYRELLKGIQDNEKKTEKQMDMEITWTPGLRQTTEQLVQKKQQLEVKSQLTPWEVYLEKKKSKKKLRRRQKRQGGTEEDPSEDEVPSDVDLNDPFFTEELGDGATEVKTKKKKTMKTKGKKGKKEEEERTAEEDAELESRKAEMALLMDDPEDGEHKHFNYDEIVERQNLSKKKRKHLEKNQQPLEEDHFQVDVSDPRFQAVFTSALFNLDPSDPHYKKTRGTHSLLAEKQRRRAHEGEGPHETTPSTTQEAPPGRKQEADGRKQEGVADPGLSLLVKSIKSKTQQFHSRKKHKTT